MSPPQVVLVEPGSAASTAGLLVGDEIVAIDGQVPRDVLEYRWLVDDEDPTFAVRRDDGVHEITVAKAAGEPVGLEVHTPLFDQVTTCDNHCEFCFIHQLPSGMRPSLAVKDDDYRLSFLYGNFTTLTRFTEADLERVLTEGLSPLYVSIHATDPRVRARMLRNQRGATSLRWLRMLLDHGVEVHGQVVVCPGRNDGAVLDDTLAGVLDEYPELASVCVVPLGVSRHNREPAMRPHTPAEAAAVVDAVEDWQDVFLAALGHRLVFAADEYYLLAGRPFPDATTYAGFPMHEDGVGMAAAFADAFASGRAAPAPGEHTPNRGGFFSWVDGAGPDGYRRPSGVESAVTLGPRRDLPATVLTGTYGAQILRPLLDGAGFGDVEVLPVENRFFGGNIGVAGLLVGEDLARVLEGRSPRQRHLLPDRCLSDGRFLDGTTPADLPVPVEIIPTDGASLRAALGGPTPGADRG